MTCVIQEKVSGSEGVEDIGRHTVVTSQNGCLIPRSESRGTHGIALDGEDWYDLRDERLIITPDGTTKEEILYFPWHIPRLHWHF